MSEGFVEIGFGQNDGGISGKRERFKGRENEKYRLSLGWWPGVDEGTLNMDAPTPRFIGAKRHFLEGAGYILNKGPEYTKLFKGEAPKMALATVVIVWPISSDGKVDIARVAAGEFKVLPWIIGSEKYDQIKGIHQEFPLGEHDLNVHCSDAVYQKMTFAPTKDSVLRKLQAAGKGKAELFNQIVASVKAVADALPGDLARDLTLDQIREKLGETVSGPVDGAGNVDDLDGMIDNMLSD